MFALLLVAVALGLSNFAAAIGIGIGGVQRGLRIRMAVVFGVFEAGMPLLGLALGDGVARHLGDAARYLGGAVLILVGCYACVQAIREGRRREGAADPEASDGTAERQWRLGRMLLSGFALSVDNLAAGFALGAYHVSLGVAAVSFGIVSVVMSLAGLELGARLGTAFGTRSELAGGLVLIVVGAVMAAGAI